MTALLVISSVVIFMYVVSFATVSYGFIKLGRFNGTINRNDFDVKISVVIATRNEENNIENCILSLVNQNYPMSTIEIIVVDDHSSDKTLDILGHLSEQFRNFRFYSLVNKKSKKEAIKYAIKKSSNDIVLTTDADCILPDLWVATFVDQFLKGDKFIYGPINFKEQKSFLYYFQQLDMFAMQGLTFGVSFYNKHVLCNAANMAFYKVDHQNHLVSNEFSNPSGDDVFLLHNFVKIKAPIKAILSKNFVVETKIEDSIQGLFNQRLRWASKTRFYKNNFLNYFSYLIFSSNLFIVLVYFQIFFIENNRNIYIILLLSKWLIDFILLFLVSSFFNKRKLLKYFVPVQLIYPIYILTIGLMSQFFKFSWKDRLYNE